MGHRDMENMDMRHREKGRVPFLTPNHGNR